MGKIRGELLTGGAVFRQGAALMVDGELAPVCHDGEGVADVKQKRTESLET
jgi:hypothetical protein